MLNTNQGFNAYAVLVPAIAIIESMPDGNWKWVLLTVVCLAAAFVGFKTKGDVVDVQEIETAPLPEVLKKGRK